MGTQHLAIFPQLPVAKANCPFPTPSFSYFSTSLAHAQVCQRVMPSKALLRAGPCRHLKAILSTRLLRMLLAADACSHPFAAADVKAGWLGMWPREMPFFTLLCLFGSHHAPSLTKACQRNTLRPRSVCDAKVFLALN